MTRGRRKLGAVARRGRTLAGTASAFSGFQGCASTRSDNTRMGWKRAVDQVVEAILRQPAKLRVWKTTTVNRNPGHASLLLRRTQSPVSAAHECRPKELLCTDWVKVVQTAVGRFSFIAVRSSTRSFDTCTQAHVIRTPVSLATVAGTDRAGKGPKACSVAVGVPEPLWVCPGFGTRLPPQKALGCSIGMLGWQLDRQSMSFQRVYCPCSGSFERVFSTVGATLTMGELTAYLTKSDGNTLIRLKIEPGFSQEWDF